MDETIWHGSSCSVHTETMATWRGALPPHPHLQVDGHVSDRPVAMAAAGAVSHDGEWCRKSKVELRERRKNRGVTRRAQTVPPAALISGWGPFFNFFFIFFGGGRRGRRWKRSEQSLVSIEFQQKHHWHVATATLSKGSGTYFWTLQPSASVLQHHDGCKQENFLSSGAIIPTTGTVSFF